LCIRNEVIAKNKTKANIRIIKIPLLVNTVFQKILFGCADKKAVERLEMEQVAIFIALKIKSRSLSGPSAYIESKR
jgi:hypothetical protein